MLSADQVPVTNPHSRMQWPKWVVLIAGSTGSALRAVRPPQPSHHAMVLGAISSDPQRGWIIISLAPSHHCPGHSGELVGNAMAATWSAVVPATLRPRPILGAVDLGIANDGESLRNRLNDLALPNRGGFNSTHIHGTHVPVEEPSTASRADSCTATNVLLATRRLLDHLVGGGEQHRWHVKA